MEKNNKLIAEFMGAEWHKDFFKDVCIISPSNISYKFHTSWDWLMPVISKITKDERYIENEYRESIMDVVPYGNIEDTIKTIVEFIKNQND